MTNRYSGIAVDLVLELRILFLVPHIHYTANSPREAYPSAKQTLGLLLILNRRTAGRLTSIERRVGNNAIFSRFV
jgi:hypothetical protein